jgi:fibronectin-binding autotransporter adhesin
MKHITMRFLLLPGLFLAMILPLQGATYVWDTSTTAGYQAGDGNWESYSVSQVWNTDGTGTTLVPWTDGNDAVFSASGTSNVNVDTVSAASVQFDGTGYSLNGGIITNAGSYVMNQDATIYSELGGSLLVQGPGTLTFYGGITTSNRIVICSAASTVGHVVQSGGSVAVTNEYFMVGGNATQNCTGVYTMSDGDLDNGYGLYIGWGTNCTGTVIQNGGYIHSTSIYNQGIVTASGTGNYYLNSGELNTALEYLFSNLNFYFGGGTLQMQRSFTTPAGLLNTTIQSGATATIDTNGKTVTWTDAITGSGDNGLVVEGAGTLNLNGNNTFTGGITIYDGKCYLNGTNSFTGGVLTYGGDLYAKNSAALPGFNVTGKIAASGGYVHAMVGGTGEWTEADIVTLLTKANNAAGLGVGIDTSNAVGGMYNFGTVLTGNLGVLKLGNNTLVLPASNSYSGGTVARQGVLKATGNTSFGSGTVTTCWGVNTAGTAYVGYGAIDLNGCTIANPCVLDGAGDAVNNLAGTVVNTSTTPAEITGNIEIGPALTYICGSTTNGDVKFSGQISGYAGIFKWGSHTLTLSGTSNTYQNHTYIESGVLEVTKLAKLNETSSIGQASYDQENQIWFSNFYGGDHKGQTLRYIGNTASTTDRVLVFNYAGTADNIIDASGTTPSATLTFTADTTFDKSAPGDSVTLTGANTGNNTFAGNITDTTALDTEGNPVLYSTSLIKDGPGKWVLSGVKSYTGDTIVKNGTLQADAIVNSPNVTVLGGELIAGSITTGTLTIGSAKSGAAPVPEPSTMILLAAAGLGLLFIRRHRRQS